MVCKGFDTCCKKNKPFDKVFGTPRQNRCAIHSILRN